MSTEEDIELNDLVAQTLEKNGCLAKLRAELRASIFLALDEDMKLSKQQPLKNLRIQSYLETPVGRAMFGLVREFLDFFNLQFTISVFEPESYLETIGQYESRQKIAQELGLDSPDEPTVPLLQQLLSIAQGRSKSLDINLNLDSNVNSSYVEESLKFNSSYNKTEIDDRTKSTSTNILGIENNPSNRNEHSRNESVQYLNSTYDLNSPTVNLDSLSKISSAAIPSKNILDSMKENDSLGIKSSIDKTPNILSIKHEEHNATFDLSSPTVSISKNKLIIKELDNGLTNKVKKEDDTYEDTSSIGEDSEIISNANNLKILGVLENEKPTNQFTRNQIKTEQEKHKLSPQRTKNSLSSLTDLPPLQMGKPKVNTDILPSLYSKDFKNKSNLKELDKMFDMDIEYEEDFMYSSNELSMISNQSKGLLKEPPATKTKDLEKMSIHNRKDGKVTHKADTEREDSVSKQHNQTNLVRSGDNSNSSNSAHSLSD